MPSYYPPLEGTTCQGCNRDEQTCAGLDCRCCTACTHTFDGGETRRFLCFGCCRVITTGKDGPLPSKCPLCKQRESITSIDRRRSVESAV